MATLKIAEYRLSQDKISGFVAFRLFNPDGTVSNWIGGGWMSVPFTQFSSLVGILTTGNAYYDEAKAIFLLSSRNGVTAAEVLSFDEVQFTKTALKTLKSK